MLQELEPCTLLIVHPQAPMLLAMRKSGVSPTLPEIQIPKFTRLAEEATEAVAEKWGLSATALFRPELSGPGGQALVLTLSAPPVCGAVDLEWVPFADFSANALLESGLRQLARYEDGDLHGPFCRRRWIGELEAWVSDCVRPLRVFLTGKVRQYNCGQTFALLRFETDQRALWFKATGDPNRQEFTLTRELTRRAPEFVPQVIAFHDEWNGWLMIEAPGERIDICGWQQAWSNAAQALATVQTRFSGDVELLQRIRCRDRSLDWLESRIEPFFQQAEAWMHRQPAGTAAQPLAPAELQRLSERVRNLIAELRDLGIAETLVHGDINAGNVIVSQKSCIFLDWAEGWVSHPFVSFEYFAELLRKTHPDHPDWLRDARAAYSRSWRERHGNSTVDRAFGMSPAIAVLVYALACAETPCRSESLQARREPLLRSLIRRVDRETRGYKEVAA